MSTLPLKWYVFGDYWPLSIKNSDLSVVGSDSWKTVFIFESPSHVLVSVLNTSHPPKKSINQLVNQYLSMDQSVNQ